jgi:choline dehydrogenase-like flavoprotein
MLFTRGSYHDYDNWANYTGDQRWSYKNVLQYFKEYETWDGPFLSKFQTERGDQGKIRIAYPKYKGLEEIIIQANVEIGIKRLLDINVRWDTNGMISNGSS